MRQGSRKKTEEVTPKDIATSCLVLGFGYIPNNETLSFEIERVLKFIAHVLPAPWIGNCTIPDLSRIIMPHSA